MSYLLHLYCVFESGTFDHLANVIMHILFCEGARLSCEQVGLLWG